SHAVQLAEKLEEERQLKGKIASVYEDFPEHWNMEYGELRDVADMIVLQKDVALEPNRTPLANLPFDMTIQASYAEPWNGVIIRARRDRNDGGADNEFEEPPTSPEGEELDVNERTPASIQSHALPVGKPYLNRIAYQRSSA